MNENRFTGRAGIYAKYRPTYPQELIDYLYTDVGFTGTSKVADVGAGTGIFSRLLAARGSAVVCVEPNADMLATAKKELAEFPRCTFVQASAENTGLKNNSVDFITVAQAFHWFDRDRFKHESGRIMSRNGKVVLVWNSRDNTDSLTIENAEINRKFCPDFKGFSGGSDENPESYQDFFRAGHCEFRAFKHRFFFDEENFVGRALSSSYAPLAGTPAHDGYVKEMIRLFDKYSRGGILAMENVTRSYSGEV